MSSEHQFSHHSLPSRRGLLAVALAVACAAAAFGTAPAEAQGLKIGVFDKQRIVDESNLGVAARERFERLQSEREVEVAEKQAAFESLQESYTKQASVLSEDRRLSMKRELARARDEWQSAAGNADRDLQRAYQSALLEIVTKIDPVIREYGRTQGYDFLFDIGQVAFRADKHDVTDQLIARIDAAHSK